MMGPTNELGWKIELDFAKLRGMQVMAVLWLSLLLPAPVRAEGVSPPSGFSPLAQSTAFEADEVSESGSGALIRWDVWYIKLTIVVFAFLASSIFLFYVLYQILLQRGVWPKTAYGITAAAVLGLTDLVILCVYWDDLVIRPTTMWWHGWGLRLGVVVAGGLVALFLLFMFKSEKGRSTA